MIVTGIPGTGKTTVCREAQRIAEERGIRLRVVNFGDVMMRLQEEAGGGVEDRDKLRKSSLDFQKKLQAEAARRIAGMIGETEGHFIVDTHMSIKTRSGYLAGLPSHVLQILKPDLLILVEADPGEILRRRLGDATRERDVEEQERGVAEELRFSRLMAAACAVLAGAAVKIVENPPGEPEKAAEEIVKLLEG